MLIYSESVHEHCLEIQQAGHNFFKYHPLCVLFHKRLSVQLSEIIQNWQIRGFTLTGSFLLDEGNQKIFNYLLRKLNNSSYTSWKIRGKKDPPQSSMKSSLGPIYICLMIKQTKIIPKLQNFCDYLSMNKKKKSIYK